MLPARLAVVCVVMFLASFGFWWMGLKDHEDNLAMIQALGQEMQTLRAHIRESDRVVAIVNSLRNSVHDARMATDEVLEGSRCFSGDERLDRIERLLREDADRRAGLGASGAVAGGVQGAGDAGGVAAP